VKERGILFSSPMVRALLAGTKTQTRRILKPGHHKLPVDTKGGWTYSTGPGGFGGISRDEFGGVSIFPLPRCPYGVVGDRLWVRETHAKFSVGEGLDRSVPQCVAYRATCDADGGFDYVDGRGEAMRLKVTKWTPGIHMPRWASRITLEITDIRLERVQDISEADAKAEGMLFHDGHSGWRHDVNYVFVEGTPRGAFFALWRLLNGEESLRANPWVWAISFTRLQPPEGK
jgi:hypothetical protein